MTTKPARELCDALGEPVNRATESTKEPHDPLGRRQIKQWNVMKEPQNQVMPVTL